MHTAYQSMFTCFSIVIFVYLFVKEKFISNWTSWFTVAVQMLFILLLSSRMQILIMMVLVPVYFLSFYYKRKKFFLGLLYTGLIFGFSYLIIKIPSSLNYRYNQTVSHISSIGVDNGNSDARKIIWTEGLEVIKNNWFFGAGNGDAKGALLEKYSQSIVDNFTTEHLLDSTVSQIQKNKKVVFSLKEKAVNNNATYEEQLSHYAKYLLERKSIKYKTCFNNEYNFHNQYLQTFGEIGVVGFLLL